MSNFNFLRDEWDGLRKAATKAELSVNYDPRAACFHARRTLEIAVQWIFTNDSSVRRPYDDQLNALIHENTFRRLLSNDLFLKIRTIKDIGNLAVHSSRPITINDALRSTSELFHFLYWLARTYTRRDPRTFDGLIFNPALLPPPPAEVIQQTRDELKKLQEELQNKDKELLERQQALIDTDAEIQKLRAEIAEAKKRNQKIPDDHDYSEAETILKIGSIQ
ncbi:MAG: DUF4145 domain-containing protein [Candidatus Obscuribacterales bacterium]|nr:DUF4145 domain-containing protein [Candidatus Obscuribacterales bacterium]